MGNSEQGKGKTVVFTFCDCGRKPYPHGHFVSTGGEFATGEIKTQRQAGRYIDGMLRHGSIQYREALRLRQDIAASALTPPQPNDFVPCTGCWVPAELKHSHLVIQDEQCLMVYSTGWALEMTELIMQQGHPDLTAEDHARMKASIRASGLPETSPIDVLAKAIRDRDAKRMQAVHDSMAPILQDIMAAFGSAFGHAAEDSADGCSKVH